MRHVFSSREVFHKWAHGSQSNARNAQGNMSFQGELAYSYAEPIARRIVRRDGTIVFLFRDKSFSNTTSKHQSHARRSVPGNPFCFDVAHVGGVSSWESDYRSGDKLDHKRNLRHYAETIATMAGELSRSRHYIDGRYRRLERYIEQANRYAALFKLATRFTMPALDMETLRAREARHNAKRAAQESARESARQVWAERQRIESAEKIAAWIRGESVTVPYGIGRAYLRLEGSEVVTSLGARVPVPHVARALSVVMRLLERGETYQRNGHTIHLGDYALDSIDASGLVTCGCHRFDRDEVTRFAGILAANPAPTPAGATSAA